MTKAMKKNELLHALQSQIRLHSLDYSWGEKLGIAQSGKGAVMPGCGVCKKPFATITEFIDHINDDVLSPLLDNLFSNGAQPVPDDYLDPEGFWADPDRNIHRAGNEGGEQEIIAAATDTCSKAEWSILSDRFLKEFDRTT